MAYQVCECTRSVPAQPPAIARSTPSVCSAALARAELRQVGVRRGARLVARRAERLHPYVEVGEPAQRADQLGDVHPGAAVDLRRVLLGQDVDAHARTLPASPAVRPATALDHRRPRVSDGPDASTSGVANVTA